MRANLLIATVTAVFMVTGFSVQDAAAKPGATTVKRSVTKKAPTKKGLTGTTAPGKRDVKKGLTKGAKPVPTKAGLRKSAINTTGVKPSMAKPGAATIGKPALKPKARPAGLHGAAGKPAHKPMVKEGHPAARRPSAIKPTGDRPDAKKAARNADNRPKVDAAGAAAIQKKAFQRKSSTK